MGHDAYLLVLAALLLLAVSSGDRFGRRAVFGRPGHLRVGSLLCSVAPSLPALVAFRMLQGL